MFSFDIGVYESVYGLGYSELLAMPPSLSGTGKEHTMLASRMTGSTRLHIAEADCMGGSFENGEMIESEKLVCSLEMGLFVAEY